MALLNFKAKTNNIKLFKANIHVLLYTMYTMFFVSFFFSERNSI